MKRHSPSLIIKKMQLGTTLRYYFVPVRMTHQIIIITSIVEDEGKNGSLVFCWWKCKMVHQLLETVWRFLKNKTLKIELLLDPTVLLLVTYPKKMKSRSQRDICTCMFIVTLFTILKTWKQSKCSSAGEWGICGIYIIY